MPKNFESNYKKYEYTSEYDYQRTLNESSKQNDVKVKCVEMSSELDVFNIIANQIMSSFGTKKTKQKDLLVNRIDIINKEITNIRQNCYLKQKQKDHDINQLQNEKVSLQKNITEIDVYNKDVKQYNKYHPLFQYHSRMLDIYFEELKEQTKITFTFNQLEYLYLSIFYVKHTYDVKYAEYLKKLKESHQFQETKKEFLDASNFDEMYSILKITPNMYAKKIVKQINSEMCKKSLSDNINDWDEDDNW